MDEEERKMKMDDGVNTSPTSDGIYLLAVGGTALSLRTKMIQ